MKHLLYLYNIPKEYPLFFVSLQCRWCVSYKFETLSNIENIFAWQNENNGRYKSVLCHFITFFVCLFVSSRRLSSLTKVFNNFVSTKKKKIESLTPNPSLPLHVKRLIASRWNIFEKKSRKNQQTYQETYVRTCMTNSRHIKYEELEEFPPKNNGKQREYE